MSPSMISEHIPDLDLITSCAERQDSVFSRASPWTKLILLILVVLVITLTANLLVLSAIYIGILVSCFAAGLPMRKIIAWYAMPVIFVLSLVGILAWTEPGIALISIPLGGFVLTLTDQGVLLVVTLLLKALISVTFSLFFLMTTKYAHFSAMVSRIFPSPLDQVFLLAYRFLFLTLAMAASLLKAVRSRGGGLIRSIRVQGRLFAGIFGLVFIRSFERAERVEKAMAARGYNGSLSAHTKIPAPGIAGYFLICAGCSAVLLLLWISPHAAGGW
ncbi:CbiQ family ECF transporter T component [Methanoregula sp.]|uniref:energy-coupling factor transporter transmembrane component T family protein n=1 Tax=Methanoregula sp. TaxID=2052170 RepID=UPI0026174F20|nr:CbiQ family ECF transporter T component [Methanoregula sp.]MDD5143825.1 CbiQ family ECF transporter T component [Methanoregula sp.]